jgi:hypothetical protein
MLFEKLIVTQLVKKSWILYGNLRFITITVFTEARHWSLSWASRIQFAPIDPNLRKVNLTTFSADRQYQILSISVL